MVRKVEGYVTDVEDGTAPGTEPDLGKYVEPSRRRSRPKRTYSKHGLTTLRAAVRALGPRVLDRRTTLGKQLATWKTELVRDLGGDVSTQQAAVVEVAVRTKLLLDSVDAWLLVQPSLVNLRKRALLPVVLQRQQLADSLCRMLRELGLERKAKEVDARAVMAALQSAGEKRGIPVPAPAEGKAPRDKNSEESKE